MISTSLEMTDQYVLVYTAWPHREPPTPTASEMMPQKGKCTLEIHELRNFHGWFLNVAQVLLEMDEIKLEQVPTRAMKMVDYGEWGGIREFDLSRQVE